MLSLKGHIALVTGGSQGIGKATALLLAQRGADVAVMARSLDKCEAVAAEINALGVRGLAVRGDLAEAAEITAGVKRITEELGPVSILVNNAAITEMDSCSA
jgi:NAD(P)-dependent dehydrogenase (short-subunit alcohol dehydrogenase family)